VFVEVRGIVYLAMREQDTAYAQRYSAPVGYPRAG
jgi:hypothetical protein